MNALELNPKTTAVGIIDAQRGFMPREEGLRLGLDGFGELPIMLGERIVPNVNELLGRLAAAGAVTFTTQDWHPHDTAHFSEKPDFATTWPRHCVADTPGAELHPGIHLPRNTERFTKGFVRLEDPAKDTSYTGLYAANTIGQKTPEWLEHHGITTMILGGLALDYCVGLTALDYRTEVGLDVIVARDATASVAPESEEIMLERFEEAGVQMATTEEILTAAKVI